MKRIRVAGIIPMNGGFALMHRMDVKKNPNFHEYYTFPGGGLETGETKEEGTIREIKEEFGINVKVIKELYKLDSKEFNQEEYYYLCKYIDGKFGTGQGPEFSNDPKYVDSGKYLPEIIKPEEIKNIRLLPPEIKEKFVQDIEKGETKIYI